jgi:hypothetical protein
VWCAQSPASGAQAAAAEVRARYEALLSAGGEAAGGRMLLMGFNGLFAAVELRARELADHLALPLPPAWRKIDHINDAMHMSVSLPFFKSEMLLRNYRCYFYQRGRGEIQHGDMWGS